MPVSSSGVIAFTVAWVPTGMKIGVSIVPCAVAKEPSRARPSCLITLKSIAAKYTYQG
ncbi:hypothetical protein GURASL_30530 [Geotalea uraniireducens]|uniref:Uncharacterized protein n=1 Tax=Geotalea uraniireducens TaxID=351604 RepID=A0ABM8ENG3_9BACT|nr:hypothetical protein GURASL_30530 [Geotalea uraniireducens]